MQLWKVCPAALPAYEESPHVKSLPVVLDRTLPHWTAHCEDGATSMAWADAARRTHRRGAVGATSDRITAMKQIVMESRRTKGYISICDSCSLSAGLKDANAGAG